MSARRLHKRISLLVLYYCHSAPTNKGSQSSQVQFVTYSQFESQFHILNITIYYANLGIKIKRTRVQGKFHKFKMHKVSRKSQQLIYHMKILIYLNGLWNQLKELKYKIQKDGYCSLLLQLPSHACLRVLQGCKELDEFWNNREKRVEG